MAVGARGFNHKVTRKILMGAVMSTDDVKGTVRASSERGEKGEQGEKIDRGEREEWEKKGQNKGKTWFNT